MVVWTRARDAPRWGQGTGGGEERRREERKFFLETPKNAIKQKEIEEI
jgi:hypothetical protein